MNVMAVCMEGKQSCFVGSMKFIKFQLDRLGNIHSAVPNAILSKNIRGPQNGYIKIHDECP